MTMPECDSLAATMLRAWKFQRRWCRVYDPSDGVLSVICSPRTAKRGTNYWVWGYRLTTGGILWRNCRTPYISESNPERRTEPAKVPPLPQVARTSDQLLLYDSLMKGLQ